MSMFKKYFSAVKRVDDLEAEVADLRDRLSVAQAKLANEALRTLERKVQGHSGKGSNGPLYPINPEVYEAWVIESQEGHFSFRRLINGRINESYRPMDQDEATLAATAIIHGFQPPRRLYRLDKPTG
ncbi:hypothetical protein ACPUEK_15980 [Marinomonas gallaica]|uniref:hypothetical protein n=1 Tax=Marinomonas gallaica TaxID=1806667 RepID=UPI003CE4D40A